MTQEEIIEGNKLIAEFMEFDFSRMSSGGGRYHTSWEWLMMVVEKIGNIYANSLGNGDTTMKIDVMKKCSQVLQYPIHAPIETIWSAVVQFTKWYKQNENTPNNNSHSSSV